MRPGIEPIGLDREVEALLQRCELPTSDLGPAPHIRLFGCRVRGEPVGVVGLEVHGAVGLLRSLAVAESQRRRGLGSALVAHVERQAAAKAVRQLYLLTTSARRFFERRGYKPLERLEVPAPIAATSVFSELCPTSSTLMCKALAPGDARPRAP